jgi:hypothetical protein
MTRYMPGQPQNHKIWWYSWEAPHSMLGSGVASVYDLWTGCGGGVEMFRGGLARARPGSPRRPPEGMLAGIPRPRD